jgi:hypothetical protein
MTNVHFQGETYNDDRMFVTAILRGTIRAGFNGTFVITIDHDRAKPDATWLLVTFRNVCRYMAARVDEFEGAWIFRGRNQIPVHSRQPRAGVAPAI